MGATKAVPEQGRQRGREGHVIAGSEYENTLPSLGNTKVNSVQPMDIRVAIASTPKRSEDLSGQPTLVSLQKTRHVLQHDGLWPQLPDNASELPPEPISWVPRVPLAGSGMPLARRAANNQIDIPQAISAAMYVSMLTHKIAYVRSENKVPRSISRQRLAGGGVRLDRHPHVESRRRHSTATATDTGEQRDGRKRTRFGHPNPLPGNRS
jgi:hypothetical protein